MKRILSLLLLVTIICGNFAFAETTIPPRTFTRCEVLVSIPNDPLKDHFVYYVDETSGDMNYYGATHENNPMARGENDIYAIGDLSQEFCDATWTFVNEGCRPMDVKDVTSVYAYVVLWDESGNRTFYSVFDSHKLDRLTEKFDKAR